MLWLVKKNKFSCRTDRPVCILQPSVAPFFHFYSCFPLIIQWHTIILPLSCLYCWWHDSFVWINSRTVLHSWGLWSFIIMLMFRFYVNTDKSYDCYVYCNLSSFCFALRLSTRSLVHAFCGTVASYIKSVNRLLVMK